MSEVFTRSFQARWGDMDFNGHMRNTAYLDVSGDVRMMYFEANGFPMRRFEELKVGPVIVRDDLEYFRELRLLEPFEVTLLLAGLTADGMRFRLRNELFDARKKLVARVTSTGGWLDLGARRLTTPPEALAALLSALPRTADYEELASRPTRP